MKALVRGGGYLLLFALMSLIAPYLFKRMPFVLLPLLLLAVLVMIRQDLIEQLRS
ncbi:MAG TPA: hypothetical protein V6D23_00755 [Candidatus Obscuribacterales bacterium]